MFDCVYPSRTARFGTALVPEVRLVFYLFLYGVYTVRIQGTLRLKTATMAADYRPIDDKCDCLVCQKDSRAHLHAKITKVSKKDSRLLTTITGVIFFRA